MSRTITVRLLGHFQLEVGGEPRTLAYSESRLLALLCLQPGDVSREWVAGTVWPEVSTSTSLRRLRSTLSRLRHAVPDAIRSGTDSVGLATGVEIDLRTATSHARAVLSPDFESTPPVEEPELFARDLLSDWYEEWIEADREIFRNLRVHALERMAHHALSAGRYGTAIDACLRVLRVEPYRETTHRLLVEVYLAEGNRTKAIDHARHYLELVRSELGVDADIAWGWGDEFDALVAPIRSLNGDSPLRP
ncbi:MAG: BTAD domain-containing putative transcriptional regulator [Microthrixaceae bacterium]